MNAFTSHKSIYSNGVNPKSDFLRILFYIPYLWPTYPEVMIVIVKLLFRP